MSRGSSEAHPRVRERGSEAGSHRRVSRGSSEAHPRTGTHQRVRGC